MTITGYIFLNSSLENDIKEDDTLTEAINVLRNKYHLLIGAISLLTIVTYIYSFATIVSESQYGQNQHFPLIINTAGSLSFIDISVILYFAYRLLDPNRIERISTKIYKSYYSKNNSKGSFENFIKTFKNIEEILQEQYQNLSQSTTSSYKHISNSYAAKYLFSREIISSNMYNDLLELIKFRNTLIHGKDTVLQVKDNEWANSVLDKLKAATFNT